MELGAATSIFFIPAGYLGWGPPFRRTPQDAQYEQLELKFEEMGDIGISETIRILLSWSLENTQLDFLNTTRKNAPTEISEKIQNKILQHVVTSYYLIKGQIVSSGEEGLQRNKLAHEKGDAENIRKSSFKRHHLPSLGATSR